MVGPKVHVIIQFRTTVYMVSRSSYQPYVIRHVHDLGNCVFTSPKVFYFDSNNASYIYPLARSRLWFCWQALHRHIGREWIPLALLLGSTMPFAFLFKYLYLGFVCRSLWAYWCASKGGKGEDDVSVLDQAIFVLRYCASDSANDMWTSTFCQPC